MLKKTNWVYLIHCRIWTQALALPHLLCKPSLTLVW